MESSAETAEKVFGKKTKKTPQKIPVFYTGNTGYTDRDHNYWIFVSA